MNRERFLTVDGSHNGDATFAKAASPYRDAKMRSYGVCIADMQLCRTATPNAGEALS